MPDMIEGSVLIMSRAGLGTAMFSMGKSKNYIFLSNVQSTFVNQIYMYILQRKEILLPEVILKQRY